MSSFSSINLYVPFDYKTAYKEIVVKETVKINTQIEITS
jgi:hypothetical protein